jgi:hypothetical protein
LGAMLGARIAEAPLGRADLPTGRRADFGAFFISTRALLALFLSGRRAVLEERPAVLVDWVVIHTI